jgi:hypothetical protein
LTDYSDVPQVNALHLENENITRAINMIDGGGTISNFTVTPPPPAPGDITMVMAATIALPGPADPQFVADARAQLVTRSNEITAELSNYGVTNPPAPLSQTAAKPTRGKSGAAA